MCDLAKGTRNRSSDLMNPSGCTSLHSDLSCLCIHDKSTSQRNAVGHIRRICLRNMLQQKKAQAYWAGSHLGCRALSWHGFRLRKTRCQIQAKVCPPGYYLAGILCETYVPLLAKSQPNGSRTHQIQAPNLSTCKISVYFPFSDSLHHLSSKRCQKWP